MLERLKSLEDNIKELLEFRKRFAIEDVKSDKSKEWALRYGFLETIQIIIDISCHLVSKYNLGNPQTYSECIELLEKSKYIDESLSFKILGMIGLRNILVHEYLSVQPEKLYELLNNIEDFKEFVGKVKDFI